MSLLEMPTLQHAKYYKNLEFEDQYDSSVAVMLQEMQREVNTKHPKKDKLDVD